MERYTDEELKMLADCRGVSCHECECAARCDDDGWNNAMESLAKELSDYRATGLTPEQCADLQKEVIRLAQESVRREVELAKLEAEVEHWAKAEGEGRLVILPLALGTRVYEIYLQAPNSFRIRKRTLYDVRICEGIEGARYCTGENEIDEIFIDRLYFTTREAAEAALAAHTEGSKSP